MSQSIEHGAWDELRKLLVSWLSAVIADATESANRKLRDSETLWNATLRDLTKLTSETADKMLAYSQSDPRWTDLQNAVQVMLQDYWDETYQASFVAVQEHQDAITQHQAIITALESEARDER